MANRGTMAALLLVVYVDMAGFGIVIPFLPFWAEEFGAAPDTVTYLVATFSLMQFIFAPFWGGLSDRIGRKPILVVSLAGSILSFLWLGFAEALWMLFAGRLTAGAMSANIVVAQAYIADVTPSENRARGMGLLGAALGMGFITGPAIGGLLAGADPGMPDFRTPMFVGAGVSALAMVLCLVFLREPPRTKPRSQVSMSAAARLRALTAIARRPAVALPILILAMTSFAMSGLESTFALWAERQLLWGPRPMGFFLAYIGVCMAVVQGWAVGHAVHRIGERRTVRFGLALFVAGLVLIPFTYALPVALLGGFLIAAGLGLGQPALDGLISRNAEADEQGQVMGAAQSAQSLARIFGPPFAGILFATFGRNTPYIAGAAIAAIALLVAFRLKGRADPPRTGKGEISD